MLRTAIVAVALAGKLSCEALAVSDKTLLKRDGAGGHGGHDHGGGHAVSSGYSAPASDYGAPAASYGAPASDYGAPAASYGAPASDYGAPAADYGAPAASYGAGPSYGVSGYEEETLPDLTPIIIGILALIGLSLLFPTFVSVNARKKRDTAEDVNPLTDVADRVNDIFNSVYQSEECMQRIACEVGGIASDLRMNENPMFAVAGSFLPSKYSTYYKQFQSGKNCDKIKCGSFAF